MPIVQLVLQICIWLFDFLLSRYKILNISVYECIFLSFTIFYQGDLAYFEVFRPKVAQNEVFQALSKVSSLSFFYFCMKSQQHKDLKLTQIMLLGHSFDLKFLEKGPKTNETTAA